MISHRDPLPVRSSTLRPFPHPSVLAAARRSAAPFEPGAGPPFSASDETEILSFGQGDHSFVTLRARRMIRQGKISIGQLGEPEAGPDAAVTAVIPARNEAATIAAVVRECLNYAGHVIVVEGGSSDATAAIAQAAGARVVRDPGLGKGAALRLAIAHVETPLCVFVDADGSHDPIDIPLLIAPIHADLADHVTGSRLLGGSDELHGGGDEFLRLAGSAFITYLINRRYGTRLSDSQNGFRAMRTADFRHLDLTARHTTIEMEMIMAALAAGLRIAEVPTHERPRAAGFSKISLARPGTWFSYGWCLIRGLCRRRTSRHVAA
jgi:glycosyltransferase involved in cell wall biosynthesis